MRIFVTNLTILLVSAASLLSGNNPIKFEDFFCVNRLGIPLVSPDGQRIAFTVNKANIDENNYMTQIWLVDRDGNNLRQVTKHASANTNPVFSADGKNIYFLSDRSGSSQVWYISLLDSDIKQITNVYGDIESFILSPNNDRFIFARKVLPDCDNEECIKRQDEIQKNNPVKARTIDALMYRYWDTWLEGHFSHLFLLSSAGKIPEDLTPGPYHAPPIDLGSNHDYTFSPDGKEICYVTNTDDVIATSTNNDIFVISPEGGKPLLISRSPGNDNNPNYSPEGTYIAYSSMARAGFEADRKRIMLYNRITKETRELTTGFKFSAGELIWSPDGTELFFTAEETGNHSIYKVSLEDNKIYTVLKGHNVSGVKFLDSHTLVFSEQTSRMPTEIFSYDLQNKDLKPLTHFNEEQLRDFDLPAYEEFWFLGAQGDSIQGFIMKPPQFEEGKKYPAVHLIHGGPQGMWSNEWHYRWNYQMFAAPGYVVYYINFHGSTGYGQKFTDSISKHWGDLPYEDIVKATEYVIKHYDYIDPDRLGAAGASYGGFMINWIAGHDNPYKCLVSHDGVYDQVSMWGSTEELWFPEWEMGGVPWQAGSVYGKWSPSRLAANFKTPTLIIHGENDFRIPYTQGLQFFTALQRQGVPSRLLFFPDENHFVRKPKNARFWWKTVYSWLNTYLQPENK